MDRGSRFVELFVDSRLALVAFGGNVVSVIGVAPILTE